MFCHNCGKQIPDGTRFCRYCGVAQDGGQSASASAAPPPVQPRPTPQQASWQAQSQPTPQQATWQAQSQPTPQQASWQAQSQPTPQQASWQAQPQPTLQPTASQEHVLPGIFGAFLCSLAGVAVMVLLNNMGYVSSLSGIVMLACTVWGYSHFGKAMSTKGIIFSVLIVIAMIYAGNRLCWAIMLRKAIAPSSSFTNIFFFFRRLPLVNRGMAEAYQESLIQQYAFASAGVIFLVINLVRGSRAGKKK